MPWSIKFNQDKRIIEITYSGTVTPQELHEAFLEAKTISSKHGTILFLADCTDMVGGHSVVDLYYLIALYEQNDLRNRIKEAIVLPSMKSPREEVQFYETACLNKGFNVKIFSDTTEAITWLAS
jgi:hypothetical protein